MTDTEFEKRFIAARKAIIEAEFSHLNEMQRKAVMATEGPLLLLAGAGSGKTTVLINRIANILKYGRGSDTFEIPEGITGSDLAMMQAAAADPAVSFIEQAKKLCVYEPAEPWRVIAITFTNKAADELKSRLEAMLGPQANDVWAMTFHSACVRILRRYADRLGFGSGFTIYDTADSQSLMKRIIRERDLDEKTYQYKAILSNISKSKDALISADEYARRAENTGDIRKVRIGQLYQEYTRRLTEANAMDFDDLIFNTVRLLLGHEDARDYYQRRFKYVLIDEYQDTNNLQYLLSSTLAGGYENICVVGDDDQSIYRFRGATIENILNFEKQYKDARVIRLEENYRSTGHILDAANAVIRNNQGRKGKELWTKKPSGDKLTLYIAHNENDEARYVASRVLDSAARGENWRDNAVLYRMNAQSRQLEQTFVKNNIPYRIIGGHKFFERAEIKDMTAYLSVVLNPNDEVRLLRIINTPARGIGAATVEAASAIAAQEEKPLIDVLRHADTYAQLQRANVRMRQFANMLDEFHTQSETLPVDELYDLLLERTGYMRMLQEKATDENITRAENVQELKTGIIGYIKDSGDSTLAGYLDMISLYTDLDQFNAGEDKVVLMTMHSAKGLEFPNVYIVGAEEGLFPGLRSIGQPDEMEEERRLCYVALTRAMFRLYITCARQRSIFGRTSANKPSRFIEEIPAEYIDIPVEANPPERSGYGDFTGGGFEKRGGSKYATKQSLAPAREKPAQKQPPSFNVGDRLRHKVFGNGAIIKITPMGGDHLVEIEFEEKGIKKLMLKVAAQHMEKI